MARTTPTSRRSTGALCLVFLASAVAAQDLALASFDPLTSNRVPDACKAAYAAPIAGCRRADFTGDTCSAACLRGVDQMQENIQVNCGGVLLPIDTLLAQALLGNLRRVLCPGSNAPPTEISTTPSVLPSTAVLTSITPSTTAAEETPSTALSSLTPAQPSTFIISVSTPAETPVQPTQTPPLSTPNPPPAPTENEAPAETQETGGSGSVGPGGNDILNPISAAPSTLPRLGVMVLVAAAACLVM